MLFDYMLLIIIIINKDEFRYAELADTHNRGRKLGFSRRIRARFAPSSLQTPKGWHSLEKNQAR
jgi:hypothetical protein